MHKPSHCKMNPSTSKAWMPCADEILIKAKAVVRITEKTLNQVARVVLKGKDEHHQSEFRNGDSRDREVTSTARESRRRQLVEYLEEDNYEGSLGSVWRRVKWPLLEKTIRLSSNFDGRKTSDEWRRKKGCSRVGKGRAYRKIVHSLSEEKL